MKTLSGLFVFAFLFSFLCGQSQSLSPTVAPAVDGGGLSPVESTAAASPTTGAHDHDHEHEHGQLEATAGAPQTATAETPGDAAPGEATAAAATATTAPAPQQDEDGDGAAGVRALQGVEGALVRVTLASQVGVLLDDYPAEMRARVVEALRELPQEAWLARAERQARLTRLRLNFRDSSAPGKGQLPLPQPDQWSIALDDAGLEIRTVQGHELLMLSYTLTTTILTDAASLAESEPALAEVGDVWEERFLLPADPDMLLQRTGRACINDAGFPPNSVDSQNAGHFYDDDRQNCFEVLAARVGAIETRMRFARIAWDDALAGRVRTPLPETGQGADLQVVGPDLENNYITYRYVAENDCAFVEGAVGAPGWRRLLHFEATVHNVGDGVLHIGRTTAGGGPQESGESVFVYAPCHDHVHYRHYGVFTLDEGELAASKQAFCVQSTDRMSNHELSPMTHDYSCRFQGIQVGWVDEYIAGLDTQWVDLTDVQIGAEGRTFDLGFESNPEGFLCEGEPGFDENGELLWEPSGLQNAEGVDILRPQCRFAPDWDANNVDTRQVFVPQVGSVVTQPCQNGELGPLRDCGFEPLELDAAELTCRVGQAFNLPLTLESGATPLVVRACERSAALGTGIPCTLQQSLANAVLQPGDNTLSFTCPAVRDGEAQDGNFALYLAPLWVGDGVGGMEIGG